MNSSLVKPLSVEMINTDSRGGNELHAASLQQLTITISTRTHYQGISVTHVGGHDFRAADIYHIWSYPGKRFPYIRYLIIYYYLHFSRKSTQKYLKNAPI